MHSHGSIYLHGVSSPVVAASPPQVRIYKVANMPNASQSGHSWLGRLGNHVLVSGGVDSGHHIMNVHLVNTARKDLFSAYHK